MPAAILYADIEAPEFKEFHQTLTEISQHGKISYRVRYREPAQQPREFSLLSGYGVELALKKTDYMVMDDRNVQGQEANKAEQADGEKSLIEDEDVYDIKPLRPTDVASLGTKAASFVLNSDHKLDTLRHLVQDFPKFSSIIASGNHRQIRRPQRSPCARQAS